MPLGILIFLGNSMNNPWTFGDEILIPTLGTFQFSPRVTALTDGRFVLTWSDVSETVDNPSGLDVQAQIFNADGRTSGSQFVVNTTTANWQFQPEIAALSDGGFVVSWTDVRDTGTTKATRDTIRDFSQAQGDRIDLSGMDARDGPGNQAFTFIATSELSGTKGEVRFTQNASRTVIRGDTNGDGTADFSISLDGLITLTAGDFIL